MNPEIVFSEFSRLGFDDYVCVSASHNEGINYLKDLISEFNISDTKVDNSEDSNINLAILGKPNVGKSTLVNSFLGEERFIALDKPGTTRDSISALFQYKNNSFLLTDTAGIRKKGKVTDIIEKFSVLKAIKSIEKANVCILVIDATEGIGHQDLQILGYILEEQKPLVIAVNKWDKLSQYEKTQLKDNLEKKLSFLTNFEKLFISATKKIGLDLLLRSVLKAYQSSCKKFSTSILNNFIQETQLTHLPPINKGIRPKLKFSHQGGTNPPLIIIHGNHLSGIKKDYIKFLESSFTKKFNLVGTPLIINFKEGINPYIKKDRKVIKTGLVTRRRIIDKSREKLAIKKQK